MVKTDERLMMGRMRFRGGDELLSRKEGAKNTHQLSKQAQVSHDAAGNYVDRADTLKRFDGRIVCQLYAGLGYSLEEFLAIPLGEVFSVEEVE